MKKVILISLIITSTFFCMSQHFEWASVGTYIFQGYSSPVVDNYGNIIVLGRAINPDIPHGNHNIYDAKGTPSEINAYNNPSLIISYNPFGVINWIREVIQENGYSYPELLKAVVDKENNIYVLGSGHGFVYFKDIDKGIDIYDNYFVYCISSEGKSISVEVDTNSLIKNPLTFNLTKDHNFLITCDYGDRSIIKTDKHFKPIWSRSFRSHSPSCCTSILQTALADVSPEGDIYISGVSEVKKSIYESILACYSNDGDLKWVKKSIGPSQLFAVKATNKGVILGGSASGKNLFGKNIDTSGSKKMVIVSFDNKGQIQWFDLTNANFVTALCTDHDQNVYMIADNRRGNNSLIAGPDTFPDAENKLIIMSYSYEGKYRWTKVVKTPWIADNNPGPQIISDECGNIYITGELVLLSGKLSKYQWFDALKINYESGGLEPFIVKLKNTLPPEIINKIVLRKDTIPGCIISPGPWKLTNYPNPFSFSTTFVCEVSYDDDHVSLEIYSLSGELCAVVFKNKKIVRGKTTSEFSNNNALKAGTYIAVLRGTDAVAITRLVII